MAAPRNPGFASGHWTSADGVRLYYRDYGGGGSRPPILCLPGLTRNCRDFEGLARRLSAGWRVVTPDLRGRGESGHAPDAASYVPATYAADVEGLLAALGIGRFVAVGTSLGGLVTMLLAAAEPRRIAGALINDVGPVIEAAGLARIRGYVGRGGWYPTWLHAARALAEGFGAAHPDHDLADWLAMARRQYRLTGAGRIVPDYDMRIAEPMRAAPEPGTEPDLWPLLGGLAGRPVTILRGERSDILSAATARRMAERLGPGAELVTLSRVGHAPTLDEPDAVAAIDRLLERVAAGEPRVP